MNILYKSLPIDIILCMLWSIILVPISLFNIEGFIRIILGFPFILFIPGYILIYALFPPRKNNQGMNIIERISLSFGFSIALVPLFCFVLNYTPWGIRLESVLFSICIFIISIGFVAVYRWMKISPDERFRISLHLPLQKSQNKLNYTLNIVIIISIIIAVILSSYIILMPKTGEKFTEFYLVGLDKNSEKFSKNLTNGVNTTRIIEIMNHEYKTINYTVELWLINYTQVYNESANKIEYAMQNMWFIYKTNCTLNHMDINYSSKSFIINRNGTFTLTFLLNKMQTPQYNRDKDYIDIAKQKISNAYREIHQWINVYYHTPPKANFTYSPEIPNLNDLIYFTSNTTSPEGRIIEWKWDFGDRNISYGNTIGLDFDGIDNYIDCGNDSNMQPVEGTIEAWIYPKELLGTRTIFTTSADYGERHPSFIIINNMLRLVLTNNTQLEQHTFLTDFKPYTWYYVTATWNSSNVGFYIDGWLKETQSKNITPAGNKFPKRIGAMAPPVWSEAFNGSIKDMRIYNRTLNGTEIQKNYNGNITTDGLVSWWMMNDNGKIAYDSMGRNNGIIYGSNQINQASHIYRNPGSYNVRLTITNENGQIDSISKTIIIT
ncbi:Uncharacterised protein [uncultured archaeon]|nr:Uncharacterised protein [uncultured archaeon]